MGIPIHQQPNEATSLQDKFKDADPANPPIPSDYDTIEYYRRLNGEVFVAQGVEPRIVDGVFVGYNVITDPAILDDYRWIDEQRLKRERAGIFNGVNREGPPWRTAQDLVAESFPEEPRSDE